MSHYSVLVLTDDDTTVEELLAPFNENIEVEPYVLHTKEELIAKEKQDIKDYKNGRYAEFLKDPEGYKEKYKDNPGHLNYIEHEFRKKLYWTNARIYKEAIRFYEPEDITEDGSVMSTYNPNSKWDWYVEGGRWSNELKLKEDSEDGALFANSARASEVDFSRDEEEYEMALRNWDLVVEGATPENEDEEYIVRFGVKENYLNVYKTRENFANISSSFRTYAVLTPDGEWHEPGQMGWWGISHANEEEKEAWWVEYPKFIRMAIENDWTMTVVDCHI